MSRQFSIIPAVLTTALFGAGAALAGDDLATCATFPDGAESYACTCEEGFVEGGVWGTGVYTTDSNICAAAQHAGAITSAGGRVKLVAAAGQETYPGSSQNGITSQQWGAFDRSFMFVNPGLVVGAAAEGEAAPEACSVLPGGQASVTCSCAAGSGLSGGLWGSGPYTADSSICAAAQHAGVIGADGGIVTALRGPGVAAYRGSSANGVTSFDWEGFDSSLIIDRN